MEKHEMVEKNLDLERLVFFSDAVVAIAITLLALDLKIEIPEGQSITFSDIVRAWPKIFAFLLSFFIVALFWRVHHKFFHYIRKINGRLFSYNLYWLLFIVALPFATTLISRDYQNTPSAVIYCGTILMITILQNFIWDYVALRPDFIKNDLSERTNREFRIECNIAMINAGVATVVAFLSPGIALIILSTRQIMFYLYKKSTSKKRKYRTMKLRLPHNPDEQPDKSNA